MSPQDTIGQNTLVHEHFILDAELEQPLDFNKRHEITRQLIDKLIESLGMVELGSLLIYDAVDPAYPGWSFIQPITTSHISGHYFEEVDKPSHLHLDIYSCKKFEWELIITILDEDLQLAAWSGNFIFRKDIPSERSVSCLSGRGHAVSMLEERISP